MAPRSRAELLSYSEVDPLLAAEAAKYPLRGVEPTDPFYGRNDFFVHRELRAARLRERHHLRYLPGPVPEVREEDLKISVRDGIEITVRVYTPISPPSRGSPFVVMFHEGGWCMGDLSDEEVNCRLFSRDLGAVCVNVDYRLAPEHPFPTGINDCWDALQWAAQNAHGLNADPKLGFIIGGGSAGGNIAAVLAHVARDEGLTPCLTGQYLCVPAIMCFQPPESIPERYRDEFLSHPSVSPWRDIVLQPGDSDTITAVVKPEVDNPLFVPLRFGERQSGHKNLPPAYFQIAGLDPLRDEGLIYERILREESGVETRLDIYPGHPHYFWTNFPRLEKSKQFVSDTVEGVKWLLNHSST